MSGDGRSYQCIDCRAKSPVVETEYTLISSRFGWRLTRRTARDGALLLEWRCPNCWHRYKVDRQMAMTPADGVATFQYEPPNSSRRGNNK
jgi:hypothetical protein